MNLYLISQNVNDGWDTFDSAVVAANDVEQARDIHPRSVWHPQRHVSFAWGIEPREGTWATKREEVQVRLIGVASDDQPVGVICASFNAG